MAFFSIFAKVKKSLRVFSEAQMNRAIETDTQIFLKLAKIEKNASISTYSGKHPEIRTLKRMVPGSA